MATVNRNCGRSARPHARPSSLGKDPEPVSRDLRPPPALQSQMQGAKARQPDQHRHRMGKHHGRPHHGPGQRPTMPQRRVKHRPRNCPTRHCHPQSRAKGANPAQTPSPPEQRRQADPGPSTSDKGPKDQPRPSDLMPASKDHREKRNPRAAPRHDPAPKPCLSSHADPLLPCTIPGDPITSAQSSQQGCSFRAGRRNCVGNSPCPCRPRGYVPQIVSNEYARVRRALGHGGWNARSDCETHRRNLCPRCVWP